MVQGMERRRFIKTLAAGTAAASALTTAGARAADPAAAKAPALSLGADIAGDLVFSQAEYHRRYRNIRAGMERQGIDCLVIGGNREWREGELGNLR